MSGDRAFSGLAAALALCIAACGHSAPRRDAPAPTAARAPREHREASKLPDEEPVSRRSPPHKEEVEEPDLGAIEAEVHPEETHPVLCEGARKAPAERKNGFIWPVDGVVISAYGHREGQPHEGIDIAAPVGSPIWASAEGDVAFAGEQAGYGRLVIVRHPNDLVTVYAHNAKNCVEARARVRQGEVIALVGQSGEATSPAVHFEVRVGQKTVNPGKHLAE